MLAKDLRTQNINEPDYVSELNFRIDWAYAAGEA